MTENFYVSVPVDTEGWTDDDKDFFQRQIAFEMEVAVRAVYREVVERRAEEMRDA